MDNVELSDSTENSDIDLKTFDVRHLDKKIPGLWHQHKLLKSKVRKGSSEYAFKNKVKTVLRKMRATGGEFVSFGELTSSPYIAISLKNDGGLIKFPLSQKEFSKIEEVYGQQSSLKLYQLAADTFEIANAQWNTYLCEVLVPQIVKELSLQFTIVAKLHELQINGLGSSFMYHNDPESVKGMFATLIVQLPSIFLGGALAISHEGSEKSIDFSGDHNGFSTFYSVFYSNCQLEKYPLTAGFRSCLVYNLIVEKFESIPVAPKNHVFELKQLIKDWTTTTKLVYGLTDQYSETNLSFENLTITDKAVANIFKDIAACNDLSVYLATFHKDATVQHTCCSHHTYHHDFYYLKNLVYLFGDETPFPSSAKINVELLTEIIPSDYFDSIFPFDSTCKVVDGRFVESRRRYRNAAIVVWRNNSLYPILKNSSGINSDMIDKAFERGVREFINTQEDEQMKLKISNYSKEILISKCDFELRKCCMKFHDIELARNTLLHFVVFNSSGPCGYNFPEIYSYLCQVGKAYGAWHVLADIMLEMFKNVSKQEVVMNLCLLFGSLDCNESYLLYKVADRSENDDEVYLHPISPLLYGKCKINIDVSHTILKEILNREWFSTSKDTKDILHSICIMADRIQFNLFDFAKNQTPEIFIPVLVNLFNKYYKVTSTFWIVISKYFVYKSKLIIDDNISRELLDKVEKFSRMLLVSQK